MSEENKLRSQIREYVKSVIKEDNFISRYLRKLGKKAEKKEFARMLSKQPELKRRLAKIKNPTNKDIATLDKYLTKLKNKPTSTDFRK
jgi:hypothetical protein|tara:strand:+ start:1703 stop:1966 length:264 start_codon:yes stop_codon:yes gene_type:complete